jgi:parallel beta-helix repeat protein
VWSVLSAAPALAATTLYVDQAHPNCSDSGPGTATRPFCTMNRAGEVAVAGDTVLVSSGAYNGPVDIENSGAATAPIVFKPRAGASVTLTANDVGFKVTSETWVTIEGFTVSGTAEDGVYITGSSNVTVRGLTVRDSGEHGIYATSASTNLWILDNDVSLSGEPNSSQDARGITLNGVTDSRIEGNYAHHNTDHGIYLDNRSHRNTVVGNEAAFNARQYSRAAAGIQVRSSSNNLIIGNVTHHNEDGGINFTSGASNNSTVNNRAFANGDHGIDVLSSTGQVITGNTVYLNTTSGINVEGSSTGATLANNISVDNALNSTATRGNIRVDANSTTGTNLNHDLVHLGAPGVMIVWGSTSYFSLAAFRSATGREPNGIEADPRWPDPDAGNFRLRRTSPAIDSANSGASGQTALDAVGTPRVDDPATANTGAGPRTYDDRGALEYDPGATVPPEARDDTAVTNEDEPVTVDVLANDTDPDGDALTVTATSPQGGATAAINPAGTVTYTPASNFNGSGGFGYTVSDGRGATGTASVTVTVNPAADPPVALPQSVAIDEDTPTTITLSGSDPDGGALRFKIVSLPEHGDLHDGPNQTGYRIMPADLPYTMQTETATFVPAADYNGPDAFDFLANDGSTDSAAARVSISVHPVNDRPVARDDSATTIKNKPVIIDVLANDSDVEGPVTLAGVSPAAHGLVLVNPDGKVTYQPDPEYGGPDQFVYTVEDADGATDTASVSVTVFAVDPADQPPSAENDSVSTNEDTSVTIAVLANDSDPDGDPLTVVEVSAPSMGSATINANYTITYAPAPNANGSDSFTYTVSDGRGLTDSATVAVTVTPVNDAPTADDVRASLDEDTARTITLAAADPDADPLAFRITSLPVHGGLHDGPDASGYRITGVDLPYTLAADTVTFVPHDNYSGEDSFHFRARDGSASSGVGTVSITVNPMNDPPDAADDAVTTTEDVASTIPVLANDADVDGGPLIVSGVSNPAHGSATVNVDGTVTYTPAPSYNGADAFTYTASDGRGGTDTATVSVTVNPRELVGNGGFETSTSGWNGGSSTISVTRVAGGRSGGWSAQVSNVGTAAAQCTLNDAPNWVSLTKAGTYTGTVWARAASPGAVLKARFREYNGPTFVGASTITTMTLTTQWQKLSVTYTPAAPGSSNLDYTAYTSNAPVGSCFHADDVSIVRLAP